MSRHHQGSLYRIYSKTAPMPTIPASAPITTTPVGAAAPPFDEALEAPEALDDDPEGVEPEAAADAMLAALVIMPVPALAGALGALPLPPVMTPSLTAMAHSALHTLRRKLL